MLRACSPKKTTAAARNSTAAAVFKFLKHRPCCSAVAFLVTCVVHRADYQSDSLRVSGHGADYQSDYLRVSAPILMKLVSLSKIGWYMLELQK
jgi:hypothetical protein